MPFLPAYQESGSGLPLILLHGNGGNRNDFANQFAAFSACFHVIAVDTRGHGQTPRGDAPFTLAQFALDLAVLMDHLCMESATILGFSDGGNIALLFALQYPLRVKKLIIAGANLYPTGLIASEWLKTLWVYCATGLTLPFTGKYRSLHELNALMAVQPHIRPRSLRTLTMPALVVAGTRDVIRARHTRLIAKNLPNSTLLLLNGSHFVLSDAAEAFNRAVLDFIQK